VTGEMKRGTFVFSIDIELAWGKVHQKRMNLHNLSRIYRKVRRNLGLVTPLLEKYRVPATWIILGHVALDHCECVNGKPHPQMPRPEYSWLKEDWYRYDPCSNLKVAPAWYGKDIVDNIVSYVKTSSLSHDIACHSFSHQMFGDPGCKRELAEAEVKKCIEIMEKEYGVVPKVFGFPRDSIGHIDVLKENGFIAFRDMIPKLYPCLEMDRTFLIAVKTLFSLFVQGLSYYIVSSPHVVVPRLVNGLWAVPGSLAFGEKPMVPFELVTLKAIKGIKKCVAEGKIFCMYTHLQEFTWNKNAIHSLERILNHVHQEERKGNLCVKTIQQIAMEKQFLSNIRGFQTAKGGFLGNPNS